MMPLNADQYTFQSMGHLFHAARRYLDQQFSAYGLSRNEWLILAMLRLKNNCLSQQYAKSYIGVENSYFTKILNQLEKKQWILREIDPQDRRNRIIRENPLSQEKIQHVYQVIYDLNAAIHSDLSEQELTTLQKGLKSIMNKLKEYTHER